MGLTDGPPPMTKLRAAGRGIVGAIANPIRVEDPLVDVQDATRRHRREHKCGAYTYGDGSLPATFVAAVGARRVIEVGTALGYTALSMARAAPDAHVDTIEMDGHHVTLAREQIAAHGMTDRVTVVHGDAEDVLAAQPSGTYDVAFFDGFTPSIAVIEEFHRVLRTGGLLIAGNLILRPSRAVTAHLSDPDCWQTHSLGETALCVKREPGRGDESDAVQPEIACGLGADGVTTRLAEWRSALEGATARHGIPAGLRLDLGPAADLAEIAALAAAEQECCAFLAISITLDGRGRALEVTGPPEAEPVITELFGAP